MSFSLMNSTIGWSPGFTNVENQVKSLIEAAEANIERLTAQIRELKCLCEKERSALATLRLMIVPIGKLPTELLVEIFKIAVHTPVLSDYVPARYFQGGLYRGDLRAGLRKILLLSQVSPYWRQIVHNTPQLWAEGVVGICLGSQKDLTDPYLDGLKTLLARSSPFPISVSLAQIPNHTALSNSSNTIFCIMVPTVQRWKNLQVDLDSFGFFNALPSGAFEALERLHIEGFSKQNNPVTLFQSAPRLRSFTFKVHESAINLIQLPWWQLTQLRIDDDSLGGCRTVLLQCSNLISATFNTCYTWDLAPTLADSPIVVLPFLETLTMAFDGDDDSGDLGTFFMPLSLPSLTTIDFEFNANVEEFWPTDVFSEFQTRAPKIKKISLLYSSIRCDGLIALLRHGPSLTTLHIQNSWLCVNDDFFDALRYDEADSAPVAPKLQDVHLHSVGEFNQDLFEDAVRSRWWKDSQRVLPDGSPPRVSRLKKVSVDPTNSEEDRISDELKTRMEELVSQGLDLELF
ncbi:hypothetical protein B0H13DRAFT_2677378 [Mycena leptocephala]|nr:hypothetical protein B0H13DRAFT_2677378 [Mycena leptocephala]